MRPSDEETWEAPVGPIPEFLSAGTELIHLFPGIRIEVGE